MKFFNKTYQSTGHKARAYNNFVASFERVTMKNKRTSTTVFGLTKFADMSQKEFKDTILMKTLQEHKSNRGAKRDEAQPTAAIDWVAKGATTAIKNQLQCGSCWTFSATETIESANLIARKISKNLLLAPQQIVDCDNGGSGCSGGWPIQAMQWIIQQGGQDTEASYPYTGQDGTCAESQGKIGATISSVAAVSPDEGQIYTALGTSPLSICADASQWSDYSGGIFPVSECSENIDHAIQLTGYNPSQGGYWIVRNSWGADWGVNGFIWLPYGVDACGITSNVVSATA
jgi:C1A family cysteine protease